MDYQGNLLDCHASLYDPYLEEDKLTNTILDQSRWMCKSHGRYLNILKDFPPSDVYVYVDRISCYKNGNDKEKMASAQAYEWFYWDLKQEIKDTKIHWIRRTDKAK